MKKLLWIAAVAMAVVCVGCSSGSSNESGADQGSGTPASTAKSQKSGGVTVCSEHFSQGAIATDDAFMNTPCFDADGEGHLYMTATTDCADGRVLMWNDAGWAFAGQAFNPHAAGAEQVAPTAERTACKG
jgi:hypothetical protein